MERTLHPFILLLFYLSQFMIYGALAFILYALCFVIVGWICQWCRKRREAVRDANPPEPNNIV